MLRLPRFAVALMFCGTIASAPHAYDPTPPFIGFEDGPDFVARLDSLQTIPPSPNRGVRGEAYFWLHPSGNSLAYRIVLPELDLDGFVTPDQADDNVRMLHLHIAEAGATGPHALNIFKAPCQDDRDLVAIPFRGLLEGIWDDNDLTACPGIGAAGQSRGFTETIEALCSGRLYLNVHTEFAPDGELRGQIVAMSSPQAAPICDPAGAADPSARPAFSRERRPPRR